MLVNRRTNKDSKELNKIIKLGMLSLSCAYFTLNLCKYVKNSDELRNEKYLCWGCSRIAKSYVPEFCKPRTLLCQRKKFLHNMLMEICLNRRFTFHLNHWHNLLRQCIFVFAHPQLSRPEWLYFQLIQPPPPTPTHPPGKVYFSAGANLVSIVEQSR